MASSVQQDSDELFETARWVLKEFPGTSGAQLAELPGGLINRTLRVELAPGGERWVLQRLHPIFGAEVNEDIRDVTEHLAARGLPTPRMVQTSDGALFVRDTEGEIWRALTWVEGESFSRMPDQRYAEEAGALVGRFHSALADFDGELRFGRAGVHDTHRHLAVLRAAIERHPDAARHRDVSALCGVVERNLAQLPDLGELDVPRRMVHGDLKISNLLFDRTGRGLCLVDLDTLSRMKLPFELGDAWRSWCNPLGEDVEDTRFDLELLGAAWRGYRSEARDFITTEERELIVAGILTVALELAARFAADVLNDTYFGWDPQRFESRAHHNWVRARGQLRLAEALGARRAEAERIIR